MSVLVTDSSFGQKTDPTVDDILQEYIQALGGEETLNSVTSMKLSASQTVHNDEGTSESTDTMLVSGGRWIIRNSQGVRSGFDGSRHWIQPKGYEPKWQTEIRYPFNLRDPVAYPLHLLRFPGTLTFAGQTKVGDFSAFRVCVQPSEPEPTDKIRQTPLEFLFDAKTGLLIQVVFEARKVEFSDYRDVDGVMIPFQRRSTYRFADISSQYETLIQSIEVNPKLDDGLFVAPVGDGRR